MYLCIKGTTMIKFNSKSADYSWLSNFHPSPIEIQGKMYPTVEHWFQSQKFSKPDLQEKIRLAATPSKAKHLGKTRDPSFNTAWNEERDQIMYEGLTAKFHQHADLAAKLLATGTATLQEQSPWDSYWGSGRTGTGKNQMGHLLMQIRTELQ